MQEANRWSMYLKLSNYIRQVDKQKSKPINWLYWAKQKADWLDPRTETVDDILGEFESTEKPQERKIQHF